MPRPRQMPIDATVFSDESTPMEMPAAARMLPEVTTVGNARFSASIIASLYGIVSLSFR